MVFSIPRTHTGEKRDNGLARLLRGQFRWLCWTPIPPTAVKRIEDFVDSKKCCFLLQPACSEQKVLFRPFRNGYKLYSREKKKADKRHIVLLVADLPQDQHKLRSRTSGFLDLDPPAIASAERSPKSQRDWKRKWPDSQLSVKLRPFRNIKRKQSVFFFSEKKLRSSRIRPPILALVDNPNLAEKQRPAQEDEIQRPTQSSGPTPELTP
jgi:hypothetical protein